MSYIKRDIIKNSGTCFTGTGSVLNYGKYIPIVLILLLTVSLSSITLAQQNGSGSAEASSTEILLNFKNTPFETVLDYLSEVAGLVIVSDQDLGERITVISRKPVNLDEAISLINTVLKEKDFAAIRMGRMLKIVSFSAAKTMSIPVRSGNDPENIVPADELVTHIIPINYANALTLKDNLSSLISDGADFTANGDTNVLIITDTTANIRRLVQIVNALDTHMAAVAEIKVFRLENSDAANTAKLINEMFEEYNKSVSGSTQQTQNIFETMRAFGRGGKGFPPPQPSKTSEARISASVNATADERTNSVVVSAPHDSMDVIEDLIVDLDSNSTEGQTVYIYPLKNARSENLKEVLNNLFNELEEASAATSSSANQNAQVPARGPGSRGFPQAPQTQSQSTDSSSVDELAGDVYIEADEDTNSLIIMTSPRNYEKVRNILDELDKPVPQVLIKVLIAEVKHDDSVDLGTEFSYLNTSNGTAEVLTDFGIPAVATAEGLFASVIDTHFDVKIRALQEDGKLDILSRPYILASNNQTATITVGNEVPFIRDTRTTEGGQTINTIEYEDIGIILEVTPYINPEGLVIMDVSQEISAITGTTVPISDTVNASVYAKRSSENRVIVKDGQTVVIGGLMEDRETETYTKVPLLGDIPLLGWVFKRKETRTEKTELLIFLTPTVASKNEDLDAITRMQNGGSIMIRESFEKRKFEDGLGSIEERAVILSE